MCRIAAYTGAAIPLENIVVRPRPVCCQTVPVTTWPTFAAWSGRVCLLRISAPRHPPRSDRVRL